MKKIAVIAVPFIRSFEQGLLMEQTIQSLRACTRSHTLDLIAVINEISDSPKSEQWINNNFNYIEHNDINILARAWNKGIKKGFERGADYCLVINLDLLFHTEYIENLIEFAGTNQQALLWTGGTVKDQDSLHSASSTAQTMVDYSSFLIDSRLSEKVGEFDEEFKPAYFEDNDMTYRIKLAGYSVLSTPTAAFFHYERITIQTSIMNNDLNQMRFFNDAILKNRAYYESKWGGSPGQEKFLSPFGK